MEILIQVFKFRLYLTEVLKCFKGLSIIETKLWLEFKLYCCIKNSFNLNILFGLAIKHVNYIY